MMKELSNCYPQNSFKDKHNLLSGFSITKSYVINEGRVVHFLLTYWNFLRHIEHNWTSVECVDALTISQH